MSGEPRETWIDAFGSDDHGTRSRLAVRLAVRLDYGYALTAHEARNSEWPQLAVIDEPDALLEKRFAATGGVIRQRRVREGG